MSNPVNSVSDATRAQIRLALAYRTDGSRFPNTGTAWIEQVNAGAGLPEADRFELVANASFAASVLHDAASHQFGGARVEDSDQLRTIANATRDVAQRLEAAVAGLRASLRST